MNPAPQGAQPGLGMWREGRPEGRVNALALALTALAAAAAGLTVLVLSERLPAAGVPLLPALYAIATCGAAVSAYLLAVRSRLHEHRRLAWAALGYGVAALAMALNILGFPGLLEGGGPLQTTASGAVAQYLLWHLAIPLFVVVGLLGDGPSRPWQIAAVATFSCLLVYVSWGGSALPTLVEADGTYTDILDRAVAILAAGSALALLAWVMAAGRRPPWTEAWVSVSLALGTWDIVFYAFAEERFAAMWWGSLALRTAQFVVLPIGLLAGFAALHRAFERHERTLARRLDRSQSEVRERRQAITEAHERIAASMKGDSLRMVFQPIAELSTLRVVGAEALSRFTGDPRRPPNRWFAEAQCVGLGEELEMEALRRALDRLDEIPEHIYVAVNVSPACILSGHVGDLVEAAGADRVVLEVTEHERIDDYDSLLARLAPLRERGMRLAIDDAGAGFASMRHITLLVPDVIKLDVSLTRNVADDRIAQALVSSMVSFAGHTHATIVAEGVETSGQLRALRHLGVSHGQGFLLGHPLDLPLAARAAGGSPPNGHRETSGRPARFQRRTGDSTPD